MVVGFKVSPTGETWVLTDVTLDGDDVGFEYVGFTHTPNQCGVKAVEIGQELGAVTGTSTNINVWAVGSFEDEVYTA
jgi:hypothetical protein